MFEKYLEMIVNHPVLGRDPQLAAFLGQKWGNAANRVWARVRRDVGAFEWKSF